MKRIKWIPDRLLLGRWDTVHYPLYVDMVRHNGIPTPSIWIPIRRTLLITDIM